MTAPKSGKSTVAGKTQPVKATVNDFRKLEGKPPLKTDNKPIVRIPLTK